MKKYLTSIIRHYEDCLDKHGDTHLGVDWPRQTDVYTRYKVMLDVIRVANNNLPEYTLLDFGCGTAQMLAFMNSHSYKNIEYAGLDISEKFINVCKSKFPKNQFYCLDVLDEGNDLPTYDYIVMNGVFTEKREMSFDEMWVYFKQMINKTFIYAKKGIAFNVMSKAVDWEREDLFHLSTDLLISFITKELTRNFVIRNDYGLYEYTVYIYKDTISTQ